MEPTKEMKKLLELADKRKINYNNIYYMGMPLAEMRVGQLKACLAHSIGLNLAYGAIKNGKSVLPEK